MAKKIGGVIPPIITTFDENGKFDPIRMKNLIERLENAKIHGLFVCGTYGSGPLLSLNERKIILETVTKIIKNCSIMAHVGSSNPDEVIDLAKHAESVGVDAVSTVVPFYYSYSYNEDDIKRFFNKLVNSVKIPVYIYNNPKTTGYTLTISLLKSLINEGIAGIKDSSFDLLFFYNLKFEIDISKFNYIIGTEAFIIPTIPLGAIATISGLANVFPELIVKTYELAKSNKLDEAVKLQDKVNKLRNIQHITQTIPAIYALLEILGIDAGYPKFPFNSVPDSIKIKMKKLLDEVGV